MPAEAGEGYYEREEKKSAMSNMKMCVLSYIYLQQAVACIVFSGLRDISFYSCFSSIPDGNSTASR